MKYIRNCDQCRKRKLKCDRIVPCGPCTLRDGSERCTFASNARPPAGTSSQRQWKRSRTIAASPSKSSREVEVDGHDDKIWRSEPALHKISDDDDVMLLPEKERFLQLCNEHLFTQDSALSYVIAQEDLETRVMQDRHHHDPAFCAVLLALYGVIESMFEEAPTQEPRSLFDACQRQLARSDPDTRPRIDQIRAYFSLLVGLGLFCGPFVAASLLSRACYLSQILDLHIEPSKSLLQSEREDRLRLFATVCKADWFCATGLGRTFYHVRPNAVLLPSLFGSASQRANYLPPSHWISMQMADLARQIADRDGMEPKEAYEETMRLQYILLGFESTLGDENDLGLAPSERSKRMQDRMGMESLRFFLHKPFYLEGWRDALKRPSRDICFRSTVKLLQLLRCLFDSTVTTTMTREGNALPNAKDFTRLWYHVFKGIQSALVVSRHLSLIEEYQEAGLGWDLEAEKNVATHTLASTRHILRELSVRSTVARQGLEALKDQAMSSSTCFTGPLRPLDPLGSSRTPSSYEGTTPATQDEALTAPMVSPMPLRASTVSTAPSPHLSIATAKASDLSPSHDTTHTHFDLDEFFSNTTTDEEFWSLFSWLDPTLLNSNL